VTSCVFTVVSKTSSYPVKTLSTLVSGNELRIGGLQVEVNVPVAEAAYTSGTVFLNEKLASATATEAPSLASLITPIAAKKFRSHSTVFGSEPTTKSAPVPRHDPDAPNAIVLRRPADDERLTHAAVVVDPFVGSRLRAHQADGVKFLFTAVASGSGCILADEMGTSARTHSKLTRRRRSWQDVTVDCAHLDGVEASERGVRARVLCWCVTRCYQQGGPNNTPLAKRVLIVTPTTLTKNWANGARVPTRCCVNSCTLQNSRNGWAMSV
jgi:hypothetical protein